MGEEHGQATIIHRVHEWEHADVTARNAETVTADDIGKVSWQQDTDVFYVLGDTGPDWVYLSNPLGLQGDTGVVGDTGIQGDTGVLGDTGDQGATGVQGDTGVLGDTGDQGDTGFGTVEKIELPYDFSTTVTAPPSSGEVRFNNASGLSVTVIWIHGTDRNSVDQTDLLDLYEPGDRIWVYSEVDGHYFDYEIHNISFGSGYYTLDVYNWWGDGALANGEDVKCVFNMTSPTKFNFRDRDNIPTHIDTVWYTILPYMTVNLDETLIVSAIVSGHSDDATTATWAYHIFGWIRDDGGVITSGFNTPTAITEYDSAYDVQLGVTSNQLRVQVRRNGGTNYNIDWSATAHFAVWSIVW